MTVTMLKSKIHRATVTEAQVNYIGSVTVDTDLLEAAGILEYEKVQVVNITNGNRLETYTIAGKPGSGVICLNGAAAKLCSKGDKVIIMAYAQMDREEAEEFKPRVVFVDKENKIVKKARYEKAGELFEE